MVLLHFYYSTRVLGGSGTSTSTKQQQWDRIVKDIFVFLYGGAMTTVVAYYYYYYYYYLVVVVFLESY